MPATKLPDRVEAESASDPFTPLLSAWEALVAANDALVAINLTGSRNLSREGMRLLERRAREFVAALETAQEQVSE
jgi:hypothetical protein